MSRRTTPATRRPGTSPSTLGEAARIGRLSRIREFVLGAQDGLLVRSAS